MKQIYDFEGNEPPVLNENLLQKKLEKRWLQQQTMILVLAALLSLIVMLICGFMAREPYPLIALFCFGYILVSITGGCVMTLFCTKKGGILL